jgi:predicted nicotinamide N-methyase
VLTDYPDQALVDNMTHNVAQNGVETHVAVHGYIWGRPVEPLLEPLLPMMTTDAKFDLILLSDLVFNHSEVSYVIMLLASVPRTRAILMIWYWWVLASCVALDV